MWSLLYCHTTEPQPATSPRRACSHNPDIDINTVKIQNISVPIRICHANFKEHLYLFIYGCAGSLLLLAGSFWWWLRELGLLLLPCVGFSLRWLLVLRSAAFRVHSSCGSQALERGLSVVVHGLVAPWQVDSSQMRDWNCVPWQAGSEPVAHQASPMLLFSGLVHFPPNPTPSIVVVKSLSRVWLFATPWSVASQASPSVGFPRQEH